MKIGWLTPFLGEVGGIRSIIETGNSLVKMGHNFFMITDKMHNKPAWINFTGEIVGVAEAEKMNFDCVINQDPYCRNWDKNIDSSIKILHICSGHLHCYDKMADDYNIVTTIFNKGVQYARSKLKKTNIFRIGQGINLTQFFRRDSNYFSHKNVFFCCRAYNIGNNQKGAITAYNLLYPLRDKYNICAWDNTKDSAPPGINFILCSAGVNRTSYAESIYHKADVIVALDQVSAWSHIAAEAMACGIPVISNGIGLEDFGIPDYNYVLLDNYNLIEEKIDRLLDDDTYRKKIVDNAYNIIINFTWEKRAKRLLDVMGNFL